MACKSAAARRDFHPENLSPLRDDRRQTSVRDHPGAGLRYLDPVSLSRLQRRQVVGIGWRGRAVLSPELPWGIGIVSEDQRIFARDRRQRRGHITRRSCGETDQVPARVQQDSRLARLATHNSQRGCLSEVRPESLEPAEGAQRLWIRKRRREAFPGLRCAIPSIDQIIGAGYGRQQRPGVMGRGVAWE